MHQTFTTQKLLTAFLLTSTILTTQAIAQQAESQPNPEANPILHVDNTPQHLMLFKNGFGLVMSQAQLNKAKDLTPDHLNNPITFQTDLFPNATQGSFWLSWSKDISLSDIKSTYSASKEQMVATNIPELIRASKGKTIRIKLPDNNDSSTWHLAEVIDVPQENQHIPEPRPLILPPPNYSNMAYLKIDGKINAINMYQIQQVDLVDADTLPTIDNPTNKPALEFTTRLTDKAPVATVQSTYLANGITWNPSYLVDITDMTDDNKEGTISAKAVVVNDLIDLNNVSAELIAGYPHIEYQEASSAMSLKPLRELVQQLMKDEGFARGRGGRMAKSMMRNTADYYEMAADMPAATMPSMPVRGEMVEDLYFYQLDSVNLKKGERGYFPLFAADIPSSSIYTWSIPDYIDQYDNYRMPDPNTPQTVWHALELTNTTDQPWTTASATTIKDGRILGQDTINFTPIQGKTRLKITQALSVKAEFLEQELSRKRQAQKVGQRVYDVVTMEGTLLITNLKSQPIDLEITKLVSGDILSADDKPEATKTPTNIGRVNSQTQLKWTVNIKPGNDDKLTIKYKYSFLTNGQVIRSKMNMY